MNDEQQVRLRDGEARELARSSFEHPIVLEAGAGTGKTATLVARVLTWCLGPGWARADEDLMISRGEDNDARISADEVAAHVVDRIAAITFTERAAAEMRDRISKGLKSIKEKKSVVGLNLEYFTEPYEILKIRAEFILAHLDRFFVGTIHAFCRRLLAQYALPAVVHPGFVVDADEGMSNALIEDVLADKLQEVYGDPGDENLLALATMGWGPAEIVEALGELIRGGVPAEALTHDPYAPDLVKQAACELAAPLEAFIALAAKPLADGKGNLNAARGMLEALGALATRLGSVNEAGELRDLALEVDVKRLREWGEGKLNKTEGKALVGIENEVQAAAAPLAARIAHLQSLDPDLLPRACIALRDLLGEVHARLRVEGIETFAALLRDTRDLLAGEEVLRSHIRQRFDQLLVDEFQDTDPIQYEIIEYLALDGPSFERPGLFLIGDPKQSIYGWRGADLGAYASFVGKVREQGGEVHSLQVNFRSVPAILSEVDRAIAPVMVAEEGLQPAFEGLLPAEGAVDETLPGRRRPVEYWVSWAQPDEKSGIEGGAKTRADEAREVEAQMLVRDLLDLRESSDLQWRDVAILQRTGTQHEPYLDALRAAGIPFLIEGDRNYYARREIIDATALVSVVVDPTDHVALLTWLRSSAVGLPDAALLPLWKHRFPRVMTLLGETSDVELDACIRDAKAELRSDVPGLGALPDWDVALRDAVRVIRTLRKSWVVDEADVFVDKLRALTLFEETEAARFQGAHRLANLERFFTRLCAALTDPQSDPIIAVRALRRAIEERPREEEAQPGDETLDAIRILTVHKAKGLTFDHVYVMGLHGAFGGRGADDGPACDAGKVGGQWELRLMGVPSLGYDALQGRRAEVSRAEEVRNLYVAMTRPRVRLVMAGRWPEAVEEVPAEKAKSRMELLGARRATPPNLAELFAAASKEDADALDEAGVRWVMPAPHEETRRLKESVGTVADEAAAREEQALIEEARVGALERTARPFTGTASGRAKSPKPSEEGSAQEDESEAPLAPALPSIVGTAVHQAMEFFDVAADLDAAFAEQREQLRNYVADAGSESLRESALREAQKIWDGLKGAALLEKLRDVEITGRELPLLLAPREGIAGEPAGACIGTIDLLYRDPADGAYVIADHKSDNVTDEAGMEERVNKYRAQGEVYVEAIAKGLCREGDPPPRFELWFLRTGEIVQVPMSGKASLPPAPVPPKGKGGEQGSLF